MREREHVVVVAAEGLFTDQSLAGLPLPPPLSLGPESLAIADILSQAFAGGPLAWFQKREAEPVSG